MSKVKKFYTQYDKLLTAVMGLLFIIVLAFANPTEQKEVSLEPQPLPNASVEDAKVVRIIDGDTIELEDGRVVRYIGIDTPETVKPNAEVECFGIESSNQNYQLVQGQTVRLEKDVSEVDRYGRLLRYVYVGDVFINDALVREGFANAASFPPDVKYQENFKDAEQEARENGRGLWGSCETK